MKYFILSLFFAGALACGSSEQTEKAKEQKAAFAANHINRAIVVDGIAKEAAWQNAETYQMDQDWINSPWTTDDFKGQFKVAWDSSFIYVLAEIHDDTLIDIHQNGLDKYWDDDCLEVFIDEDGSGGNHQYNYNAFAYHIGLDGSVVDIGVDSNAHFYNEHIDVAINTAGKKTTWELAIKIFDDSYNHETKNNKITPLFQSKKLGFAIAYCDNDYSKEREHFIGSSFIEGEDKNKGWIDAGVFSTLTLE